MAECGPWSADPRLTVMVGDRFLTKLMLGPLTRFRNRWVHVDSDLMHWCRFLVKTALNVSEDPFELDRFAKMTRVLWGNLRSMPPRPRLWVFVMTSCLSIWIRHALFLITFLGRRSFLLWVGATASLRLDRRIRGRLSWRLSVLWRLFRCLRVL